MSSVAHMFKSNYFLIYTSGKKLEHMVEHMTDLIHCCSKKDMVDQNWDVVLQARAVTKAWETYLHFFNQILDKHKEK